MAIEEEQKKKKQAARYGDDDKAVWATPAGPKLAYNIYTSTNTVVKCVRLKDKEQG